MIHDALSASSSHDLRISSNQGRKSDAEIKGRNTYSNREDLDIKVKYLRACADNEKIRALIQKIQDQCAKANQVLRRTR